MNMLRFWWIMYLKVLRATRETFGLGKPFWRLLFGKPMMLVLDRACWALDRWIYPTLDGYKIEKPLFIIGPPRCGSTFLHRFLNEGGEFVCFRFWEIVFPALTARKLVGTFVRKRMARGKDVVIPEEAGHEQRLGSIEEEELLFYKYLNTQFVYVYTPLAFSEENWDAVVFGDDQPSDLILEWMEYLKACWQRQMLWTGKRRIIANMNYSGLRLKRLLEHFPDARVVFLDRSPLETIPSHLTLDRKVLELLWGKKISREKIARYLEKRYRYDIAYYRYVRRLEKEGFFESSRVLRVPYEELKRDFARVVQSIFVFGELRMSEAMERRVWEQSQKQRNYRPRHQNLTLEDFGLSAKEVLKAIEEAQES
uniref:Sulfotransferase n=1 Tax=Desulfacinum infernum TaxID=35837 RepID=A0A832A0Z1_9BACT